MMRPTDRNAGKASKARKDVDSSEESQSSDSSGESSKSKAAINSRQSTKDKQVRVAPNSTSHKHEANTDPVLRSSDKRKAFHSKVKHEKQIGVRGRHRSHFSDLKGAYSKLDPAELIEKVKKSGGHLEVKISDSKDATALAKVLQANPFIRSMRLICDLGGRSVDTQEDIEKLKAALRAGKSKPDSLDEASFRNILRSCGHLQELDLGGCRLDKQSWKDLKSSLEVNAPLQSLIVGDNDYLSGEASEFFKELPKNLFGLTIRNTKLMYDTVDKIFSSSSVHSNLRTLNLINLDNEFDSIRFFEVFEACANKYKKVSHLSFAGTKILFPISDNSDIVIGKQFAQDTESLVFLDLTNCGLFETDSNWLADALLHCPALEVIKLEGNDISAKARASLKMSCERNRKANLKKREPAEKVATAAYDLLVQNAAVKTDVWPEELSVVMAQNAPAATLEALASLIGKDAVSQSDKSGSNNLKPSEPGS